MLLRSFFSSTVRKAGQVVDAAEKILNHQRDELPAKNIEEVEAGIASLKQCQRSGSTEEIKKEMDRLDETAQKWLKPYPNASWREHFEGLFSMAVLLFAFRQFFAQPMEIPTGSAQPTLWGIMAYDLRDKPDEKIPTGLNAFYERWVKGNKYYHIVARADGTIVGTGPKEYYIKFGGKKVATHQALLLAQLDQSGQPIRSTLQEYDIAFPPDDIIRHLGLVDEITGQMKKNTFKAGEDIVKVRVASGDRLFVNCLTYNFRHPKRGETIVFKSSGIPGITQGTHYIKRLIAMHGEKVKIGDDRHVYINGKALDASTPGFENVYSFDPAKPPRANEYSGHVNHKTWVATTGQNGAKLFPDADTEFTVGLHNFLCFGDNTMNSNDGRDWGDFPEDKVVGKSFFVFWPITERWGFNRH